MKVAINANIFSVTSTITAEDYKLLEKHNPDALCLKDKDENEIFSIYYGAADEGSIDDNGACFNTVTRDENKYLILTGKIPASVTSAESAKAYVAEEIGAKAYSYLETIEKNIAESAKAVKDAKKKLVDSIVEA